MALYMQRPVALPPAEFRISPGLIFSTLCLDKNQQLLILCVVGVITVFLSVWYFQVSADNINLEK